MTRFVIGAALAAAGVYFSVSAFLGGEPPVEVVLTFLVWEAPAAVLLYSALRASKERKKKARSDRAF